MKNISQKCQGVGDGTHGSQHCLHTHSYCTARYTYIGGWKYSRDLSSSRRAWCSERSQKQCMEDRIKEENKPECFSERLVLVLVLILVLVFVLVLVLVIVFLHCDLGLGLELGPNTLTWD